MQKLFNLKNILLIIIIALSFSIWKISDNYVTQLKQCNKLKVIYPPHPNTITPGQIGMLDIIPEQNLLKGKEEMKKHKLIIVGITRDNAQDFSVMVRNLENIGDLFEDYRVMLFENDSSDGTKTALKSWKINNPKVDYISTDFHNKKRPSHKFLADARNNYLDAINIEEYNDFDIVMMIDMDMYLGIDARGIEDSFSKISDWDAVCSNGITASNGNKMYDIFAFRTEEFPWSPKEWHAICHENNSANSWSKTCDNGKFYSRGIWKDFSAKIFGEEKDKLYWTLIVPQIKAEYDPNSPLIPVHSCFGGMGFYKRNFIKDCRYDSIYNDCEHIVFHQCLREKHQGRIVMNPAQIIRYD